MPTHSPMPRIRKTVASRVAIFASLAIAAILAILCVLPLLAAQEPAGGTQESIRAKAVAAEKAGNWKDAYEGLAKLALDPKTDAEKVDYDLRRAVGCLERLNRVTEVDALIENVIKAHEENWRLLCAAGNIYMGLPHQGMVINGIFERAAQGRGKFVNSAARDRVRSLQLYRDAMVRIHSPEAKAAPSEIVNFSLDFSRAILQGRDSNRESWQLQNLTNLSQLPDYDEAQYGISPTSGAPVDAEGNPIFYLTPTSFDSAKNDGERWRFLLKSAKEADPRGSQPNYELAKFLKTQFGVETMRQWDTYPVMYRGEGAAQAGSPRKKDKEPETGPYAVETLGDDETIAQLASGIKRFKLPDEFNYIRILKEISDSDAIDKRSATWSLASTFENRRQFDKAAFYYKRILDIVKQSDDSEYKQAKGKIDQIEGSWGQFEPLMAQPSGGKGATVDFQYRNGNRVDFKAYEINVPLLLEDVKSYIRSKPHPMDQDKLQIDNIGYRLVQKNEVKYIGRLAAEWGLDLKPREKHFDRMTTVQTPLKKAGAYLLIATMKDGNTSRIVVWLNDMAMVKKPTPTGAFYFVTDAVTGKPIEKTNISLFGYRMIHREKNDYEITTTQYALYTDADGKAIAEISSTDNFQWLAMAQGPQGQFAYLGFNSIWYARESYASLKSPWRKDYPHETRAFIMTDRPVYRPGQSTHFKSWIATPDYESDGGVASQDMPVTVTITDPRGNKVFNKSLKTDIYGGIQDDLALEQNATLGVYGIQITNGKFSAGGSFRVEEYKKPEFEVKVDLPDKPVMLGDKIPVKIKATYYWGEPVKQAKVKYKVLRSQYAEQWFPWGRWDWLYGKGYWWFGGEYSWFAGWQHWGIARPVSYYGYRPTPPPEVVMESEGQIGPDGTVEVMIDSSAAKDLHGDMDHKYEVSAEVTDQSRRTITGNGSVLAAREPYQVHVWVNSGFCRAGDTVKAEFSAQTLDGKPVKGLGKVSLYQVNYVEKEGELTPQEKEVGTWKVQLDDEGHATLQIKAAQAGQYRLACKVTDEADHVVDGAYVFNVVGENFRSEDFRFNEIELISDKKEYASGDKMRLLINTNQKNATAYLFVRPLNGQYEAPRVLRLKGKSTVEEIVVGKGDMPNFYIEAFTIHDGRLYSDLREIAVPPESRILNMTVEPSKKEYKPGEKGTAKIRLTDAQGKPVAAQVVLTMYDRALEYISGGGNTEDIRRFFWGWKSQHSISNETNLERTSTNLLKEKEVPMMELGIFGIVWGEIDEGFGVTQRHAYYGHSKLKERMARSEEMVLLYAGAGVVPAAAAPMSLGDFKAKALSSAIVADGDFSASGGVAYDAMERQSAGGEVAPTLRSNFADTALWVAAIQTGADGIAETSFTMPENITGWKMQGWAMGQGVRVAQAASETATKKNLMVRLQAPRFFVEGDEAILSANVQNYLSVEKTVRVVLEVEGLETTATLEQRVDIAAGGEHRVNWLVKAAHEGEAVVRMKALTDVESDAMEMRFPIYVHGMNKMVAFAGSIRGEQTSATVKFDIPEKRREAETRLEVHYSPTLAGAMVDALPYLVSYPYGCTEQTLNRFLPTVITQKVLLDMGIDLSAVKNKSVNLNAQELGDPAERAKQWKRFRDPKTGEYQNPVFDQREVEKMANEGLRALTDMQLSDGGWGWFSGYAEQSMPHTTALVVHGMQLAQQNGEALVPGVMERGIDWLKNYQAQEIQKIKNWPEKKDPRKEKADNLDAYVYMVLTDGGTENAGMREFLYRDRNDLSVYAKAMFGMSLVRANQGDKLAMIMQNIDQFLVRDDENQTAYLNLGNANYWWCWYGSDIEANAYYLKLLARTGQVSDWKAPYLVKYILNNRKNGSYWNSTRDTAVAIEALAEYLKASGEDKPDMTVQVLLDGEVKKEVRITPQDLFSFDNKLEVTGEALTSGTHTVELKRNGKGPLYFNAYASYFTLEDFITSAGLEVKVQRKIYKVIEGQRDVAVAGSHGQSVDQKSEKKDRVLLANEGAVKSGDQIEIELTIESKNDYEYVVFEDMKAAGFEPVQVQSGYVPNELGAYVEFRDNRVAFFMSTLPRGKHSVTYRMRAETPGRYSALPTRAYAMYAPELRGNSDEMKLKIED